MDRIGRQASDTAAEAFKSGLYRSFASCWMASYMLKNLWQVLLSLTLCKCTTCHARVSSEPDRRQPLLLFLIFSEAL